MKTKDDLQKEFGCSDEQAERLFEIQETGERHGRNGWYPDGDYSSDADWCYGVGARIQKLEEELGIDDNSVFDVYMDAHQEALPEPEPCQDGE